MNIRLEPIFINPGSVEIPPRDTICYFDSLRHTLFTILL